MTFVETSLRGVQTGQRLNHSKNPSYLPSFVEEASNTEWYNNLGLDRPMDCQTYHDDWPSTFKQGAHYHREHKSIVDKLEMCNNHFLRTNPSRLLARSSQTESSTLNKSCCVDLTSINNDEAKAIMFDE